MKNVKYTALDKHKCIIYDDVENYAIILLCLHFIERIDIFLQICTVPEQTLDLICDQFSFSSLDELNECCKTKTILQRNKNNITDCSYFMIASLGGI